MQRVEEALAHHYLFALCQRLYLEGMTPETLAIVQEVGELATALPREVALDDLQAAQYELFGFNLFPYESMFLGDEQLLGTAIGEAVGQQYARLGYVPTQQAGALDHVGEELGVLAYLLAAEADAREDQRVAVVQRLQGEQRQFLEAHLLRWLA
ncbi:MAG: molecular chaperone TorD family protein, partial [Caldilineaceae bacterium]|nr:molecular chaperone TorD family protein [Caldilineaceae bacterium]